MASDWEEIKRLAADFQKVQLSTSLQRLSERNCIEVVSLLIEKGLLEVIFTNDGKEYLTPEQLTQEINDELFVSGGRVNLTTLSKTINVDLNRITASATKIAHRSKKVHLILGQLINEDYIQRVATEINEKLAQVGEISVTELSEQFDLPADFIQQRVVDRHLGKLIHGKRDSSDSKVLFTASYIARCKAKIRGALIGLTRPTAVASICAQCKVKEKLFHSLVEDIEADGTTTSKVTGAQYIPNVYKKFQNEWVVSRFRQNNYVQHDSLSQFGVSDPRAFIQRQLPADEQLVHLKRCTVSVRLVEQLEAAFEECINTQSYLDVSTVLPSDLGEEDVAQLMERLTASTGQNNTLILDTTILTHPFLDQLIKPCEEVLQKKCQEAVDSGKYQQYIIERQATGSRSTEGGGSNHVDMKAERRDERRKKATSVKMGGGAQGRETKTKSTKKHYRGGGGGRGGEAESDSEDERPQGKKQTRSQELELVSVRDIVNVIQKPLEEEGLEELAKEIANHYHQQLNKQALASAQTLYEATLENNTQSRRQTHASLQEKLNNLVNDIRLYEKGLKLFPADVQSQLCKYLMKTLAKDIASELCAYVAQECNLNVIETSPLSTKQRQQIIQDCDGEYKEALHELHKSLFGQSIDELLVAIENALQACSMILKKVDKKKDRTLVLCHKHGLLEQLANCTDPALVLHLTSLVIFTVATQNMLHASGRHVSSILAFVQPQLTAEQSDMLTKYHDLVLKALNAAQVEEEGGVADGGNEEAAAAVLAELEEMTPKIKQIATGFKRAAAGGGNGD